MEIYTIGFTQKSAEEFFDILRRAKIGRVLDIRLSNMSQLAGFTKRDDLRFFLKEICGAEYVHATELAPTQELMDSYKKNGGSWSDFKPEFLKLMKQRKIEQTLDPKFFKVRTVLLCSEPTADACHRSLVAEYLSKAWGDVKVIDL